MALGSYYWHVTSLLSDITCWQILKHNHRYFSTNAVFYSQLFQSCTTENLTKTWKRNNSNEIKLCPWRQTNHIRKAVAQSCGSQGKVPSATLYIKAEWQKTLFLFGKFKRRLTWQPAFFFKRKCNKNKIKIREYNFAFAIGCLHVLNHSNINMIRISLCRRLLHINSLFWAL